MKERPILFNGAMVRAILAGTKTQTRRVAHPLCTTTGWSHGITDNGSDLYFKSPYGQPGDRLWVREAFAKTRVAQMPGLGEIYVYRDGDNRTDYGGPWKPSIHMPRTACRILLDVVSVRVERLNDISEADAEAEGCSGGHSAIPSYPYNATPCEHYKWLWESINGDGSWDANPWVWVVEFKRVEGGKA